MRARRRARAAWLATVVTAAALVGHAGEAAIVEVLACTDAALRQAISNASAGDVVLLPPCTIQLIGLAGEDANAGGDLDIDKDLTLVGSGAGRTILDGGGIDRVIDVAAGVQVVLEGLTIRNGRAPAGTDGGGIRSFGFLTVSRSEVRDNVADSFGGGISTGITGIVINTTQGQLTIEHTTVADNRAGFGNPTLGGGVFSGRPLLVRRSLITGNRVLGDSTADGGGIAELSSAAVVVESEVTGNFADRDGGGINVTSRSVVLQSAITGNTAGRDGGGLDAGGAGGTDRIDLVQSTVSGNIANRDGGGVTLGLTSGSVAGSTIADNTAVRNGGGLNLVITSAIIRRTIVAGNTPVDCRLVATSTLTSEGHNLDGDASCGLTLGSDLPATDPLLGPLAANGGPTRTQALLAGSPAIDQGGAEGCGAVDQRGVVRPQDGDADGLKACDIGAFERRGPRPGRGPGKKTIDPR